MAFIAPAVAAVGSFLGSAAGIATVVGTGLSVYSGLSAAAGQASQANYQTAVALNNAQIAKANAERATTQAQQDQARKDQQYRALEATQLAEQAGSGLDVLGRTQMLTREGTRQVRGQAASDIIRQGEAVAQRFYQDSANYSLQAKASQESASNYMKAGWLGAFNTVFSKISGASLIGGSRSTKKSPSLGGSLTAYGFGNA